MIDLSSWTAYFQHFGQFFNGFLFTIAIALGSFTLAMLLGILFGTLSTSKHGSLRILSRIFVEFYQNTPLLVQFVIVFYGLPLISNHTIMIPIYWTAVLCVGLYHGAYIAEVIRSGIQSIPRVDLMFVTKSWSALNGNYIPAFLGAAFFYFALCFPVAQFGRKMEQANKKAYSL